MVYVSPPRTFANTYAPNELLVVVCFTPRESVINTVAFLKPCPPGVNTLPVTVKVGPYVR